MKIERRAFALDEIRVERRAEGDDKPSKITGHAAVFDKLSEPLWQGFREKIKPGAFKKTLREADVRALFNHDPNFVLGRTKSKTLTVREDEVGLAFEVEPPATQWADDLLISIERGDIDQASFGFRVVKDRMFTEGGEGSGETIRELIEVELFDVSPVTFPAYPQTDVSARSLLEGAGIDWDQLVAAITWQERGLPASAKQVATIKGAMEVLERYVPKIEPGQGSHSDEEARALKFKRMGRELELLEAAG